MRLRVMVRPGEVVIWSNRGSLELKRRQEIQWFAMGIRRALADPHRMASLWPGYTHEELEKVLAKVEEAYEEMQG